MTRTESVAIAIRLLAIWFFVQAISLLVLATATPDGSRTWGDAAQYLVVLALLFLASALTWKYSVVLAGRVLPQSDPGEPVVPLSSREIERAALRVLGAFLLVTGLCGLGYVMAYVSRLAAIGGQGSWNQQLGRPEIAGRLCQSGVQVVAGIGLFLGTAELKRILKTLKPPGEAEPTEGDEPEEKATEAP